MPRFFQSSSSSRGNRCMKSPTRSFASSTTNKDFMKSPGQVKTSHNLPDDEFDFGYKSNTKRRICKRIDVGFKETKNKKQSFQTCNVKTLEKRKDLTLIGPQDNILDSNSEPKLNTTASNDFFEHRSLDNVHHARRYQMFGNPYSSYRFKGSENNLPLLPISVLSRVLAVDTRTDPSFIGDASSKSYLYTCTNFLKTAARRGVLPSILCTSAPATIDNECNIKGGKMVGVRATNVQRNFLNGSQRCQCGSFDDHLEREEKEWKKLLTPLILTRREKVQVNHEKERKNRKTEQDSWGHFSDMVDAIVKRVQERNDTKFHERKHGETLLPLNAMIITSDHIFFSDHNDTYHSNGVDTFWNRVKKHVQKRVISSISIIIVQTETCVQNTTIEQTKTFQMLQQEFKSLTRQRLISMDVQQTQPVTVTIEIIQNHSIHFSRIIRSWIRLSLPSPRIVLPLPELIEDNSRCTLTLMLEYTLLPSSVNSAQCWSMIQQCKSMQNSEWKVIGVMDLSSVNAALLFGTPMIAKAGVKENDDLNEYKEMNGLVEQFWRYLSDKEVACLLLCSHKQCDDGGEMCGLKDYYILMASLEPEQKNCIYTSNKKIFRHEKHGTHGFLFRFAMDEQLIWDFTKNQEEIFEQNGEEEQKKEALLQYNYEYIEKSLRNVKNSELNPFLASSKTDLIISTREYSQHAGTNRIQYSPSLENRQKLFSINEDREK